MLAVVSLMVTDAHAQATTTKFLVFFADKAGTPFTVAEPSAYLTARALARRQQQSIAVGPHDLPVTPAYVQGVALTGATVWYTSRWFNAAYIEADSAAFAAVRALPYVTDFERLTRWRWQPADSDGRRLPGTETELPGRSGVQKWATDTLATVALTSDNYGPSAPQVQQLEAHLAHAQGFRGEGMVVGVFDSGFLNADQHAVFAHLFADNRLLGTYDFVQRETSVYEDHSHGALVLSTLAADLPGSLIGTAPKASYYLFRTEDVFSEFPVEEANWLVAAERADSLGVDVINTSLGYNTFDDPTLNYQLSDLDGRTAIMSRAATMAARTGMLVVTSAGNEGNSVAWQGRISVPADADSTLAVAAVNAQGFRVGFSSRGPSADGRIKPDLAAMGAGVTYASTGGGIIQNAGSGTSFAAPLLTGLATCFWQAFPQLTNQQVIAQLKASGTQAAVPDSLLGFGIPRFSVAATLTHDTGVGQAGATLRTTGLLTPAQPLYLLADPDLVGQTLHWQVIDLTGRRVAAQRTVLGDLRQALNLPAWQLRPGVYVLQVQANRRAYALRFVRQ